MAIINNAPVKGGGKGTNPKSTSKADAGRRTQTVATGKTPVTVYPVQSARTGGGIKPRAPIAEVAIHETIHNASASEAKAQRVLYAEATWADDGDDLWDEQLAYEKQKYGYSYETPTASPGDKPEVRYQATPTPTPTARPNSSIPRTISFDEFMEEMPYIRGVGEYRFPPGDPRTGRNLDSSRAGTAKRAEWANETLRGISEGLGNPPTIEEVFAATWFMEAGGDYDRLALNRCRRNEQGDIVCDTMSPTVLYADNRTFGTAIEQQLAAYMVGFCGSNGCDDVELATLLGHFQAWSDQYVEDLTNTITAIRANDEDFQRAEQAGNAIISYYGEWSQTGIPAGTPYRYLGDVVINPGRTRFCNPIDEPC